MEKHSDFHDFTGLWQIYYTGKKQDNPFKIQIEKDCTYMSQENPYYIKTTEKCSI